MIGLTHKDTHIVITGKTSPAFLYEIPRFLHEMENRQCKIHFFANNGTSLDLLSNDFVLHKIDIILCNKHCNLNKKQ